MITKETYKTVLNDAFIQCRGPILDVMDKFHAPMSQRSIFALKLICPNIPIDLIPNEDVPLEILAQALALIDSLYQQQGMGVAKEQATKNLKDLAMFCSEIQECIGIKANRFVFTQKEGVVGPDFEIVIGTDYYFSMLGIYRATSKHTEIEVLSGNYIMTPEHIKAMADGILSFVRMDV